MRRVVLYFCPQGWHIEGSRFNCCMHETKEEWRVVIKFNSLMLSSMHLNDRWLHLL